MPNSSLPKQKWTDIGTPEIKVNPNRVSDQMGHPVACSMSEIALSYLKPFSEECVVLLHSAGGQ